MALNTPPNATPITGQGYITPEWAIWCQQVYDGITGASPGSGTVTSVAATGNNGVTIAGSPITTAGTITIGLGSITPTTVNGLTLAAQAVGFTIAGGTTSKTLTVPLNATVSGTNTGDQTTAGTSNRITVTNGSTNPVIDIASSYVGQNTITTLGTITTGTWTGTTIAVANGGTGQTSYTDGQLLIGNSTGNTLSKATLTAGSGVTITNGGGTITISASGAGVTKFSSTQQTITAAGSLTIAHGLGAAPFAVSCFLVCTSAEGGYSVNDQVAVSLMSPDNSTNSGASVVPDATNLNVRFGSGANTFFLLNKTTGARFNITNSNWKIIFNAWV